MRRTAEERQAFVETRAAQMAAAPTTAEAKMWEILEPLGWQRQVPVTGFTKNGGSWLYILDFYYGSRKLCVEVDGGIHKKRKGRDRRRDTRLAGEGIKTLRFTNNEVLNQTEVVRGYIQRWTAA